MSNKGEEFKNRIIQNSPYERIIPHINIEPVLEAIGEGQKFFIAHGQEVKISTRRLQLYAAKGYTCIKCGLVGKKFYVEKYPSQKRWHLNLYAYNKNGEEIMITNDHIVPKSKGGQDDLENLQPMCKECNEQKGNSLPKST